MEECTGSWTYETVPHSCERGLGCSNAGIDTSKILPKGSSQITHLVLLNCTQDAAG